MTVIKSADKYSISVSLKKLIKCVCAPFIPSLLSYRGKPWVSWKQNQVLVLTSENIGLHLFSFVTEMQFSFPCFSAEPWPWGFNWYVKKCGYEHHMVTGIFVWVRLKSQFAKSPFYEKRNLFTEGALITC